MIGRRAATTIDSDKFSPGERLHIELPQVVKLRVLVILATENVQVVFMHDRSMACSCFRLRCGLVRWRNDPPLVQLEVKLADEIDSFTVVKATEHNHFVCAVEAGRVLVDAYGEGVRLVGGGSRAHLVPV